MELSRRPLLDHWSWEAPMLRLVVGITALVPIALCCVLLPVLGPYALLALTLLCIAPLLGFVYHRVGRRVDRVREEAAPQAGSAIPALIVQGALQSPGVVSLGAEALAIRPIVGSGADVRFDEITAVREVRFFNGTLLMGKVGFWLTVPGRGRLGCAVPDSCAGALRARIARE
jgi:hypothetical protein